MGAAGPMLMSIFGMNGKFGMGGKHAAPDSEAIYADVRDRIKGKMTPVQEQVLRATIAKSRAAGGGSVTSHAEASFDQFSSTFGGTKLTPGVEYGSGMMNQRVKATLILEPSPVRGPPGTPAVGERFDAVTGEMVPS